MNLLRDRRRQLLRVLETGQDTNGQLDLSLLDRLQVQSVEALRIQYSVKAFNHEVSSDPEDLPAKYQAADGVLYFVRRGDVPWASIARELALALCPEADPGRLAAGIKEVLAATSEGAAAAMLDELGFAPLAVAAEKPEVATGVIDDLGGETAPPEQPQPTEPTAEGQTPTTGSGSSGADGRPRGEGAAQPTGATATGTPIPPTHGEPLTAEDAINRLLGPGAGSPSPLPPDLQKQLQSRPEGAGAGRGAPGRGQQRDGQRRDGERRGQRRRGERDGERRPARGGYPVLRSYVAHDDPEADREVDPVLAQRREQVNRSGMNRVLEYERQQGRNPREMPPLHPGYDVESDSATGQIERYIEVKSLSGDWEEPAGATSEPIRVLTGSANTGSMICARTPRHCHANSRRLPVVSISNESSGRDGRP
jgi:hypothetical protein